MEAGRGFGVRSAVPWLDAVIAADGDPPRRVGGRSVQLLVEEIAPARDALRQESAGHQRVRLISQSIAAIGNLGLNLYLVPRYSWLGAAWASLATDAGLGIMNWVALILLASRRALPQHVIAE